MTLATRINRLEGKAPPPVEPVTVLRPILRPDGSIEGYTLKVPGGYRELAPDHPLLAGRPPVTPETNGGYRPGERP
jgi:hypothetical protein